MSSDVSALIIVVSRWFSVRPPEGRRSRSEEDQARLSSSRDDVIKRASVRPSAHIVELMGETAKRRLEQLVARRWPVSSTGHRLVQQLEAEWVFGKTVSAEGRRPR